MASTPNATLERHTQRRGRRHGDDWDRVKNDFIYNYITEKKTLKECMRIMEEKFNFEATKKQYTRRIKLWHLHKYTKQDHSPAKPVIRSAQEALRAQLSPSHLSYPGPTVHPADSRQYHASHHLHIHHNGSVPANTFYPSTPISPSANTSNESCGSCWSGAGEDTNLASQNLPMAATPVQARLSSTGYQSEPRLPFSPSSSTSIPPETIPSSNATNNHAVLPQSATQTAHENWSHETHIYDSFNEFLSGFNMMDDSPVSQGMPENDELEENLESY